MAEAIVLNIVLYLPVLAILLLITVPPRREGLMRGLSLSLMVVQFALTAWLYVRFDPAVEGLQFETRLPWIAAWGVYYQIGLDGFNVLLVMLTAFLGPLVVAGSFTAIQKDVKLFYAMVFLIQFAMLGTFVAQDLFVFYLFWETMLIPMFLLIGIWGGERRIYATFKFFLYTAFGSILMLAAVIYLVYSLQTSTGVTSFAFADLVKTRLPLDVQTWLLAAFALSFAIKVPMVPLHTWLPDAHVEAPTPISVILAGILLKMGIYGMLRMNWAMLPAATASFAPAVSIFGVINIVYAAMVCLAQRDLKKLIAYSSVPHMGVSLLGMSSMTESGMAGAVLNLFTHGIISPMLFLIVGVIYDRAHHREIEGFGGIAKVVPEYTALMGLAFFASLGLPGLAGFVSEFLVLNGAFAHLPWHTAFAAISVVITAAYYLWTIQRIFLGTLNPKYAHLPDVNWRERLTLYPLAALAILFGFYPNVILRLINTDLFALVRSVKGV